jgi:hypothetical protein
MSPAWWHIAWTALNLFWLIGFAILEGYAFKSGGLTLSMYLWRITEAWGAFPFLAGIIIGSLGTHLWWHWLPPGARSVG